LIKNNSLLFLVIISLITFIIFSGCLPKTIPAKEETTKVTTEEATKEIEKIKGKIAFVPVRDENYEIYVMNEDDTDQINLTNNPAQDWSPAWSPKDN